MDILDQPIQEKKPKVEQLGKVLRAMEYVGVFFVLVGFVFRFQHWPGAGESHLVGFGLLALVYFPLGMGYALGSKRFPTAPDKGMMALMALTLALAALGINYRVFYWSIATYFITAAAVLFVPAIVLLLLAFAGKVNLSKEVLRWGARRLVIMGIPLWFFVFVNQVSYYGMTGEFRNVPRYMEAYDRCYNENDKAACETIDAFEEKFFGPRSYHDNTQERMMSGEEWID